MSTTLTAMFDTRAEAEAARDRLRSASIDVDNVHVHDQSSTGYSDQSYSTHEERGIWAAIKNAFLPDEDRHTYEEGLRRGGALLTVDVDDDRAEEVERILEQANAVDIDDRSSQWRSSGWDYSTSGTGARMGTGSAFNFSDEKRATGEVAAAHAANEREVIPIVEEQLVVGKRDVSRGGVRVRTYVTETPVHEQVRLRNERIDVERRPVDQPLSATDADAFRERTIDMTATGEEAVIGKNARVVEELVIAKTAEERVEQIDDTVRRTDVDIDRDNDLERTGARQHGLTQDDLDRTDRDRI